MTILTVYFQLMNIERSIINELVEIDGYPKNLIDIIRKKEFKRLTIDISTYPNDKRQTILGKIVTCKIKQFRKN